jgi:small subunit ribosomal protein S20
MPNSRQAKKRMRQDSKRRDNNRSKASAMKTAIRRVDEAVAEGDAAAVEVAVKVAYKRIDKASKANVIHDNTAARRKALVTRKATATTDG